MTAEQTTGAASQVTAFVSFAGALAIAGGSAVLVGWVLDIGVLKTVLPISGSTKANTALCFILIGVAIFSAARSPATVDPRTIDVRARVGDACAWVVGLIGAVTLAEYLSDWDPGIDQWLFHEAAGAVATSHPGRMAPESALCFLLLAISLVTYRRTTPGHTIAVASIGSGLIVSALSLAALLSHLTPQLGAFGWFGLTLMSVYASLLFSFLGAASAALAWRSNPGMWSIGAGVTSLFALGLLTLVVAGLTLSRAQYALQQSGSAIVQSERIHDQTDLVKERIAQASGDLRAYLLGGEMRYLQAYQVSNAAIDRHWASLRSSVADSRSPDEASHLHAMEELLARRGDWQARITEAAQASTGSISRRRMTDQAADELEYLLGGIRELQDGHRRHIEALQAEFASSNDVSSAIVLGTTLLSILVFLLAMLRLNLSEVLREQAARALVRSETHYRSAVQSAHDAIVTADSDGNIVGWNQGAEKLFGYTEAEVRGRALTLLMPERFRDRHLNGMGRARAGEASVVDGKPMAMAGLRKDGTEFEMELSLANWDDGDRHFFTGTLRDVSAREAAARQIRMLSQAVEQSPESIVITNLDAEIEYVNHAFLLATGYSRDEVIGSNPRILHSGRTPVESYASLWEALKQGRTWQGEFYNRRRDGSEYIEFAVISPICQADGRITHYLAIKEDITERKRSAEALQESRALLQNVIDATPDWIYVKDTEHRFLLANRSIASAFGQAPEAMIGRKDSDYLPLELIDRHEGDGMRNFRSDDDAVFRGETIHNPCDRLYFQNGESRYFDSFKCPLYDASGRVFGVLGIRRDITERINREQEQKTLQAQLWQAQKMEAVGHLTGGVAHDFNNILASILGYAELLQMSPELRQNESLARYLQEILQSGIRAKELIAQLLTFSQKSVAATETIKPAPIVAEVMQMLRSTIPTSISMNTDIRDPLPDVLISPVQLHQILTNLVVNARAAIAGLGSIRVRVESIAASDARVCDACHREFRGPHVLVSVLDSGAGIAEEILPRIFDPFFTTKEVGRGSGLGLSVLHGIVHSAGGHIEVRTKRNQGTEFRIYLPAQAARTRSAHPEVEPAGAKPHARGHIMVVDDEAVIVEYMTELFTYLGCRVTGLTSARAALSAFEEDPDGVDLLITDQAMPEMTGVDLCRAVLARRPDLPIVLNTGCGSDMDMDIARQIGIRRYLVKPVPVKVYEDIAAEYLPRPAGAERDVTG